MRPFAANNRTRIRRDIYRNICFVRAEANAWIIVLMLLLLVCHTITLCLAEFKSKQGREKRYICAEKTAYYYDDGRTSGNFNNFAKNWH